ncbi:response regulator transcription factor [Massilia sp. YIM B02769]|uniref:response regulator transcription factor n=1 Tax=unclassified Massilia TaxID=2609279 RepID=UPI0025B68A50|nr:MULTISPECIES: response regulator transcription factor [unclassified Massilia]MDN4060773.1 response regulator transcription factor [Massilia sp. YIM B02769]
MIRILIAEDQAMVRGALAALLGLEPDIAVVATAADGIEALALCERHAPDIVLTDIEMPRMTGLELAAQLAARGAACRVMIVTTFGRSGYLRRALSAGVRGFLLKDAPADALAAAIRTVHGGGRAIAPELALESWGGAQDPLTERERQVLRLAGEGASSADIARQIHLSEGTVRNYLSEAISKLGAGNRVEAYRLARDAGWL